jgi:hypothetical protein
MPFGDNRVHRHRQSLLSPVRRLKLPSVVECLESKFGESDAITARMSPAWERSFKISAERLHPDFQVDGETELIRYKVDGWTAS